MTGSRRRQVGTMAIFAWFVSLCAISLSAFQGGFGTIVPVEEANRIWGGQCLDYTLGIGCQGTQADTCDGMSGICSGGGSLLSCNYSCSANLKTTWTAGGPSGWLTITVTICPTTTRLTCGAPPGGVPCKCIAPTISAGCANYNSASNPCTPG
jgi:hypothetical protein